MSYAIGVNRLGEDPNGNYYPGHSSIYDPMGNQLLFTKEDKISVGTIDKEFIHSARTKLNFLADRDSFQIEL
jgi:predicted amidohydrolase